MNASAVPVLETIGLSKRFGAVTAAWDIHVTLRAGEVVGVIGANGAGKTTFINMVTGYLKPSAGRVLLRGLEVTGLPPRRMTRLGVMRSFQIPQLFPDLTARENLVVAASLATGRIPWTFSPLATPARVAAADQRLADYGLGAYADEKAAVLPQGVRKLLDIAMATTGQPALLLLDEPTSGVASDEKHPLMATVMAAVDRSQVATLFVEHDMEIIARYATRVMAFYSGEVISDGPPQGVLADPRVQQYVVGRATSRRGEARADG
ncbi:MAG: ABC transporter ATP-binding protein [Candidatus Competibacterales bacterium]